MPPPPPRRSFNAPPPHATKTTLTRAPSSSKTGLVAPSSAPVVIGEKTGLPNKAEHFAVATAKPPQTGQGDLRSSIDTYFAKPGPTAVLYNGDRLWTRVILTLVTAGPVAVGHLQELNPVLSGKGQLLPTGVPVTFNIAKGTVLYVATTSINRINVVIEPLPWLEQITGTIRDIASGIVMLAQALATGKK